MSTVVSGRKLGTARLACRLGAFRQQPTAHPLLQASPQSLDHSTTIDARPSTVIAPAGRTMIHTLFSSQRAFQQRRFFGPAMMKPCRPFQMSRWVKWHHWLQHMLPHLQCTALSSVPFCKMPIVPLGHHLEPSAQRKAAGAAPSQQLRRAKRTREQEARLRRGEEHEGDVHAAVPGARQAPEEVRERQAHLAAQEHARPQ